METAWKTGGDKNTRVINYNWGVCDISTPYDHRRVSESNSIHLHHHVPEMCLKLGKMKSSSTTTKRGNPRCQVEGCHVTLGDAKDYYRKHKVCELHSKAPKVMVTGVLQRFCQQCSRFHGVTEFDEAKRSCRRRLKGHNQRRRRRKGTNSIKLGCATAAAAYSLLSSPDTKPADDLPSRCSPALYELIVANRATSISAHISNQNGYHQPVSAFPDTHMWDRISYTTTAAATVDLKQAPALEFGLLSVKEKSKDPEEWTDYCWSSFGGANAV